MVNIYPHVAGNTLDSHKKFLSKLEKKGAKVTSSLEGSDVTIIFCPIVSRFETDINSALSGIPGSKKDAIVVAMHHTFDPDYTVPKLRQGYFDVALLVDCLFHERKGLLSCPRNKDAKKRVCAQLALPTKRFSILRKKSSGGRKTK